MVCARIPAAYLKALNSRSHHPVEDAATALRLPTARARDIVNQARQRGLLTRCSRQVRTEGQLTDHARTLLVM